MPPPISDVVKMAVQQSVLINSHGFLNRNGLGFGWDIETMASNHGGKDVMDSGSSEGNSSEPTVEIKIKTLDSQTYTLRVDKCVPVPALKEQIASVTGVLSEQQRLICRGKVLKDDQLLSAYHVEDGHTLHLVARQPMNPSLASFPDHTEFILSPKYVAFSASDPASSTRQHQHGPSVVVGTFNISEQGDGSIPDFSRIVSAVLGSFGIANAGSGSEAVDLHQHISERLSRIPGLHDIRNSTGQQPDDASGRGQPNPQNAAFTLPTDVSMESLQLPVIPDSLSTLSQYLRRLRQEFDDNVRIQVNSSQSLGAGNAGEESNASPHSGSGQGGLPTPAALGEVTQSARQLLIEQAGECLMQLTRQLGDQTNVTDPVVRSRMQSNALRSGALLQNLGAFLLELGRTTMTLRMGQSPTDAVVNAGPAVFISTSGPNPIMVQPLPFQPGTSFGTTPVGSGTNFSVGSGVRPRNIDIRIRTGSLLSSAVNQRDASVGERSATDPLASDGGISDHQATVRNLPPTRGSDVRVVPIRISTVPPGLAHSESSRSSMGVLYPMLARAQHADSGNLNGVNGGQASNGSHPHSGENRPHLVPDSAAQQQPPETPAIPGTTHGVLHSDQNSAGEVPNGLGQLLRNLFPTEQNHGNDFIFQGMGADSVSGNVETNPQEAPRVSDEGTFLANLLHQIMPIVSQHINGADDSSEQGAAMEDRATQPSSSVGEIQDRGASSRQPGDPTSPPSSKRQKTE
ncbi:large proline-rich protein bag6-A isoform X2 [Cynara cardunculus var. scolymus]|uniref:large proline-rich protein bag6-A isoform X2 n=1 Tax=Cynara cardunculus var. scolymus TaxID=59895 RepID=UPI000D62F1ED|nr:large proline-rich protein bag6-A isoform X2 [Cynara cardunculus var. scolymus]